MISLALAAAAAEGDSEHPLASHRPRGGKKRARPRE
jgi:hypothetical protein